jgi:hypothetical protein
MFLSFPFKHTIVSSGWASGLKHDAATITPAFEPPPGTAAPARQLELGKDGKVPQWSKDGSIAQICWNRRCA